MCMITKQTEPEVAKKAIRCYKTVHTAFDGHGCPRYFMSPYYRFYYSPGQTYNTSEWEKRTSFSTKHEPVHENGDVVISYGFHSFGRVKDALNEIVDKSTEVVLMCEIPEGARYFTGNRYYFNNSDPNYREYCSEQIKVIAWKRKGDGETWHYTKQEEEKPCA